MQRKYLSTYTELHAYLINGNNIITLYQFDVWDTNHYY